MQQKSMPKDQLVSDYNVVEKTIQTIEAHRESHPSLSETASSINLSEFYLQKRFSRWAGISPTRFLQFLTKEYAKELLDQSQNLLDVTSGKGLSSPGRLHDLFIHCDALTPGEYKSKAARIDIVFGFSPSPFGRCMIARSPRGICALKFLGEETEKDMTGRLHQKWPGARLSHNDNTVRKIAETVFPVDLHHILPPLHLHIRGTRFQIKVWEALTRIPFGKAVTYQDIAGHIGHEGADRAVGTAVGRNPLPFLIPCHRVIRKSGEFGHYGGGTARKKAMIGWEAAKSRC